MGWLYGTSLGFQGRSVEMAASALVQHRLLTVEEFDRAWAAGVYGPEERLELIDGEVIKKVSPQESPHATGTNLCAEEMRAAFGKGHHVRTQEPLLLGIRTRPEPDVAVVVGEIRDYAAAHPATAVLLIEVADTTVRYDTTSKAALYASAGIQEYWVLNLKRRVLEVYRDPTQRAKPVVGTGASAKYLTVFTLTGTDSITPLGAPNSLISVSDLLP
jgi:Uma2 family endonuclease